MVIDTRLIKVYQRVDKLQSALARQRSATAQTAKLAAAARARLQVSSRIVGLNVMTACGDYRPVGAAHAEIIEPIVPGE